MAERPDPGHAGGAGGSPDERPTDEAAAARTLALLNAQADAVRAELARLRVDLDQAEHDFGGLAAAQLLEANEKLVLAAVRADAIAETAVSKLSELTRSSQHDALTDTPNRALMLDRLENAIAMARRHQTCLAVLFIDLDLFKRINDTLGHEAGDEVLQLVAHRLQSVVRDSDTVSRYGGDEFMVLLPEVGQASDVALVAVKMLAALSKASHVGGQELHLSASIGIALYPAHGEDAATLIRGADAAMYRSKRLGPGGFEFHDDLPSSGESRAESPARQALPVIGARSASAQVDREPHIRKLREANEQLILAALTAQELKAHAEEAHRRQVRFLAMVAHELRNPLTPIRTAAALLSRAGSDEALLTRLQVIIHRQVMHMTRLVDDLLDGSRASTGGFRIERSAVEMGAIFGLAIEACRPAMEGRLQLFRTELLTTPLHVTGDPVRLAQIFSNLLDNASKYTPKGGSIKLAADVRDELLVVTVSDNGIGVTPEALLVIFDLFVQDPRAVVHHGGGLGIGLAVVRELVEAHGGSVIARSAGKNLGSEFVVTLPMGTTDPSL